MRKRSGTARAALLGNSMAWFGSAAFLLGLAGEHVDALASGSWTRAAGFVMILATEVALVTAGVLDNHRIRTSRRRSG